MEISIRGKVALVTGAGRGIGRAIAIALADEGASVVAVARSKNEIDEVAADITARGGKAIAVAADLLKPDDIVASVEAAARAFGGVDILVNNAGGMPQAPKPLTETDPDEWWRTVDLNLRAPYLYCRAVLPHMLAKRWGRIVNVGSVGSKVGLHWLTGYCAAKHGLVGLTRALALEVATKGITVNAICPGYVDTALARDGMSKRAERLKMPIDELEKKYIANIPQKVAATAEEVTASVLFLLSPGGARTTGEALNVSGGQVMH